MDNPIVVLAAPDHPLADKKKISLERLALEPWLMRERGSGTRIAIERRFAEHGITLHPRLELGSSEAIKLAILAGLGISALSRHALSLNAPGQFAVLDVEGFPILRHWYAVYTGGAAAVGGGAGVSGLFAGAGGGCDGHAEVAEWDGVSGRV